MAKKADKVSNRITKKQLLELLIDFFNSHQDDTFNARDIFAGLGIKSTSVKGLCMRLLDDLVFDGYLVEPTMNRYRLANKSSILTGTFTRSSDGYNLVYPD
ncbi:MAG: hypothetical protein IJD05_05920, partial [Bacteroidaceae bacterium]|nr:hypothetical protein [Bacteroidaceae bacterium]